MTNLKLAQKLAEQKGFQLNFDGDTLLLQQEKTKVFADFISKKALKRINELGILKQDISKAIGFNKNKNLSILDCTAGLGKDSFIFASITTKHVMMLERNPISFALLENGLQRLKNFDKLQYIAQRMKCLRIDSLDYLTTCENYDVIYLDPMFSGQNQKKSAAVKKEMAFFKQSVGADIDCDDLLPLALKKANKRVVVKRHAKAPYLNNQKPSYSLTGKANRFDIYLK